MKEYLPFVSIDAWTIIMSWGNLLILFLLLRRFLFKPIGKTLDERAAEIESGYKSAEDARAAAKELRDEYEARLQNARNEAESIVKSAVETANARSDEIVGEASDKAKSIIADSRRRSGLDRERAVREARSDLAAMAADIAEKLISKRFDAEDDKKLIEEIIEKL